MWNSYDKVRYRVQCSIIEASLGRYATHQYNDLNHSLLNWLYGGSLTA
jgi:hypothetical protein